MHLGQYEGVKDVALDPSGQQIGPEFQEAQRRLRVALFPRVGDGARQLRQHHC